MIKRNIPAVSIVVPMYNMEKYVGETLDSILAQTFDDYEVIVVDDCSTDKSCAVVESYISRFKTFIFPDRLRLVKSAINSGSAGIPRNMGISLARGEYIMFVDSDDVITNTAIEEIYPIAKKFNADVVHCEKCYKAFGETAPTNKNLLTENVLIPTDFVTEPTLMSNDPRDRVQIFTEHKFDWSTCQNFVRRDFIIQNNISFPSYKVQEDTIFALLFLCLAENIVRVPNIFYVYRYREHSACRPEFLSEEKRIEHWGSTLFKSIMLLDKFIETLDFYKDHKDIKYTILDAIVRFICYPIYVLYPQMKIHEMHELICKELSKLEGDTTAMNAFFFNRMNIYYDYCIQDDNAKQKLQAVIRQQQEQIRQLQAQLQQQQRNSNFFR